MSLYCLVIFESCNSALYKCAIHLHYYLQNLVYYIVILYLFNYHLYTVLLRYSYDVSGPIISYLTMLFVCVFKKKHGSHLYIKSLLIEFVCAPLNFELIICYYLHLLTMCMPFFCMKLGTGSVLRGPLKNASNGLV